MNATARLSPLEPGAIARGLAVFLVLTVVIPVLASAVASFGPKEWVAQYFYATRGLEPVLFVVAGVLVALVIRRARIYNSLVVATLGAVISLLLAIVLEASPDLEAAGLAMQYLLLPVAWTFVGVAGVALVTRVRNAL